MKSLSLSTPLVRTNRSRGGSPAVYIWLSSVSGVMVSGSGNLVVFDRSRADVDGESGRCRVAEDEEIESSTPSSAGEEGLEGASSMGGRSGLVNFLDLIFCEMRVWEKVVLLGGGAARYSWTVFRTAWVISSLEP